MNKAVSELLEKKNLFYGHLFSKQAKISLIIKRVKIKYYNVFMNKLMHMILDLTIYYIIFFI